MSGDDNLYNETCYPTPEDIRKIGWVSFGSGTVSELCCFFILFIIILFKKYRSTPQRVILYLTITVLLYSGVFILHGVKNNLDPDYDSDPLCMIVGFLDQVVSWMELIAICCLTFDLFVRVLFLWDNTKKLELVYFILIFIFPFTFNWIPFIKNTYGFGGSYCWIRQYKYNNCTLDEFGLILRFTLFWVPFYILILAMTIAYATAVIKTHRRVKEFSGKHNPGELIIKQRMLSEVHHYKYYPVIIGIIFSVALISRIAEAVNHQNSFFPLRLIHVIVFCLQGPVITIAFLLDRDTRQQLCRYQSIRSALYALFCPCKIAKVQEYQAIISVPTDSLQTKRFEKDGREKGRRNEAQLLKNSSELDAT